MKYTVEIDTKAAREIRALPRREQSRILERTLALADNPRPAGCVKLAGELDLWRIRSGQYRIIYQIKKDQLFIMIVKVGNRRDVYRGL